MNKKTDEKPFRVFMVVGEESGDQLGARLMRALKERHTHVEFSGTAGPGMQAEGMESIFPLSDIAVMGLSAVLGRLPTIIRRVHQAVDAAVAANPDVLVIIDSPDFTHAVAKRVRKAAPHIPIVDYVSPSVWAWRPGRARRMAAYVDHLLGILPFEPEVHKRLGGPPCSYVGHPRIDELRPAREEREKERKEPPVLLVLPGSRSSEVGRLLLPFRKTVERLAKSVPDLEILLPTVPHLEERVRADVADWSVPVTVVTGESEKFAAFRRARAALAAFGTVTLELAIAAVPIAVCYKLDWFYRRLKQIHRFFPIVKTSSMVLPNIILGRNVMPEFLDEEVCPDRLIPLLSDLLADTPARAEQVTAFEEIEARMLLDNGEEPSERAARIVSDVAGR
ncbi:lipid-A-disaccharide synthase [Breoghania sp.]|uniref:lipid-A-disaccharide synthase n=1 Tax=Breoghania sp. TaxID=2065378 RepID=UPI0026316041|nr:lipid-A-disaccharide synthase [Breoghania sp.]MDJ0929675.1 lipid-A-disaccharide synthase [Breoghania sp.]